MSGHIFIIIIHAITMKNSISYLYISLHLFEFDL